MASHGSGFGLHGKDWILPCSGTADMKSAYCKLPGQRSSYNRSKKVSNDANKSATHVCSFHDCSALNGRRFLLFPCRNISCQRWIRTEMRWTCFAMPCKNGGNFDTCTSETSEIQCYLSGAGPLLAAACVTPSAIGVMASIENFSGGSQSLCLCCQHTKRRMMWPRRAEGSGH